MHGALVIAVPQHVVDRGVRTVDGQLVPVGTAQAGDLGVQVGEEPTLQQRIVGHVDARDQVVRVERHLLRLREVVGGVPVQGHETHGLHGNQLFRHELGGIEQVDALEALLLVVLEDLHAQLPLRERPGLDGVRQVTAVEVRICAVDQLGLFPRHRVHTQVRLPVELHQHGAPVRCHQAEGVDAEALHGAEGARDAAVRHVPDGVVLCFGVQGHEVPEGVVRGLRLGDLAVRVGFPGVDDVRELDGVLDEEHRHVVAHQVPGALVRVELGGEAAGVTGQIARAAGAQHGGEAHEHGGFLVLGEQARAAELGGRAVAAERAVGTRAAGVHHALRDALVVEVGDLLAEVVVLQQDGPAGTGLQCQVRGGQPRAVGGGQVVTLLGHARGRDVRGGTRGGDTLGRALIRLGWQRRVCCGGLFDGRLAGAGNSRDLG